jgi:hypothetical protein
MLPKYVAELLDEGKSMRSCLHAAGDGGYPVPPPPHGACCGLVLRAWQAGAEGAAAILYDFNTHVLEVGLWGGGGAAM